MKSDDLYKEAKKAEIQELKDMLRKVGGSFKWEGTGPYVEYTGGDYNHDVEVLSIDMKDGFINIEVKDKDSCEILNATTGEIQYGHLSYITSSFLDED